MAQVGVALCKIAGGSLRRMAAEVTPLLIDRFIYYAHPARRAAKQVQLGASSWNGVEIKNYATVINDIFTKAAQPQTVPHPTTSCACPAHNLPHPRWGLG